MKIKRSVTICLLLISTMVASVTSNMNPDIASAESNVLKWTRIDTPGSVPGKNDIVSSCEVNKIAIGSDGKTFYAVDIPNASNINGSKALYKSTDSGISWSDTISKNLYKTMTPGEQINFRLWNLAVAPDNVNFIAVVTNDSASHWPRNIWISTNGGTTWENTNCPVNNHISTVAISPSYNDYDIAVGIRTGTGNGTIYILKASEQATWSDQGFSGDVLAMNFSPNYVNDSSLVIISSDVTGTHVNIGIHDQAINTTRWDTWGPIEITTSGTNTSPNANQIITADLELPSDFSGQVPCTRRCYISIDDNGTTGNAGIYRIDDTTVYKLMPATTTKRISSIAYYGNYASGKLLVGEVLGDPCTATVMTWFTDSPTTCPIPCWYPAMKPPTGGAGNENCIGSGYGNAQVAWAPDGSIAYTGTASSAATTGGVNWPSPYIIGEDFDESAFSITYNNGEIWNQLALLDTSINQFIDIAPAPDCSTVYLASINENSGCSGFDSVWRSQSSTTDTTWERILCQASSSSHCAQNQTDNAILRLAGDKTDGQIVFWTAIGSRKIIWSPDFGDYWTDINPQLIVQDMAAEDSETLYILDANGCTQKLTFSGVGRISGYVTPTGLDTGYSIATAYTGLTPDNHKGNIIVGGKGTGLYDVAYSTDGGKTFDPIATQLPTRGDTMVIAHSGYKSNGEVFAINSGGMYEWSIYYGGGTWSWPLPEKDKWATQWGGPSWPTSVTGLSISRNGSFYFSDTWGAYVRWTMTSAGIDPTISFGINPTTRLRICGGLITGDPITVWLIDQRPYNPPQGGVWRYVDTLAWNGPVPTSPISDATVPHDPVSGRAGEINLTWQPVSMSRGYQIQIAKDADFALEIANIGEGWLGPFYTPPDLDAPALMIPPGGGTITDANGNTWIVPALEANHSYYWRVLVRDVATGDPIQSPWSWRELFTVEAGLPATHPYYGPHLLLPDNGCLGCPIESTSFSWSPFKGTTMYKFVLAKDAAMSDVLVKTELPTTSYNYDGILDYNTNYFWQVQAVEPIPSNWSATFCFHTESAPTPQSNSQGTQLASVWIWLIIIIGAILDVSLLVLAIRRL